MKKLIRMIPLFLLIAQTALAFDGKRDGFVLGTSISLNHFTIGYDYPIGSSHRQYSIGPGIGVSLGAITEERNMLTLETNIALTHINTINGKRTPALYGSILGFSYTCLIRKKAPTPFLNLEISLLTGLGGLSEQDGVRASASGPRFGLSFGYEFKKHYFVRLGWSVFGGMADFAPSLVPIVYQLNGARTISLSFGVWAY